MNILVISSGNAKTGISPLVKNQGESLKLAGCQVDYFAVEGKGIAGYLRGAKKLRSILKKTTYDLLHAHYGLSALSAWLGNSAGLSMVVSFMGDDVMGSKKPDGSVTDFSRLLVWVNRQMARFFYDAVIVKSEEMKERLGLSSVINDKNTVNLEDRKSPPLEGGDLGVVENESQSNGTEIDFENGSKIMNEEKKSFPSHGGEKRELFRKEKKAAVNENVLQPPPTPP